MDEMLLFRLNLLVGAKEIDASIREALIAFVKTIEARYSLQITEDNGAMLVTHLAMALGRICRDEQLEPVDDDIFAEVREMPIYKELPALYQPLEKELQITLPQVERDYLALHLGALLEAENLSKGG